MAAFNYIAVNTAAKEQKGVIEAESEKHARQLLRDKTLVPIRVTPAQTKKIGKEQKATLFSRKQSLSAQELALVTRQFATLLSAGLPIEECLLAVGEQADKQRVKSLVLSIRAKVTEGHALAQALRDHPQAFTQLYCATVAAGEKTGHLDKVLVRLADYTEQQWNMQQKLKSALIYPAMIILVAFGIVGFLLEFVVPKMVSTYSHMKQELPTMTHMLIKSSEIIKSYGIYFLISLVVAIIFGRRTLQKSLILREKMHRLLLRIPLLGYSIKSANTARFARTLSILSASGVPVLEAMNIASQLITTIPIKKAIEVAVAKVREGASIHLTLKATTYFSPMSIHMIASGEASGQLESMLERVAINQENEITRMIEVMLALFEPAIILVMGAVVLFIVLAVLLPIFNMNQIAM